MSDRRTDGSPGWRQPLDRRTEQAAAKDFGLTIDGPSGAVVLWRPGEVERGA